MNRRITTAAKAMAMIQASAVDSTALVQNLLQSNYPLIKTQDLGREQRSLPALNCRHLDDKLMDLPNDLAVKTLLFEKTCDLERQFGEKHLVIWTNKRQTG
jgi:hypothetical protein